MNKLIIFLTFLALGFLMVMSSVAPNASAVWLAASTDSYNFLRAGTMVMLLVLVFTNPPRDPVLRSIIGVISVALIAGTANATYEGTMLILDGLVFMSAGIASLIAVLEYEPIETTITIKKRAKKSEQFKHLAPAA